LENNKCGCEDEPPAEAEENVEPCCGSDDTDIEEDAGCCCGAKHPDESLVDNPDKPTFIADDEFIKEFEKRAHSIGIKVIGYTQLTSELLIKKINLFNTQMPLY